MKVCRLQQDGKITYMGKKLIVHDNVLRRLKHMVNKKNKEIAGNLSFEETKKELVITGFLNINKGSTANVKVVLQRVSFHTHPCFLYAREATDFGWPSLTDYRSLINHSRKTDIHIVASCEGLWFVCFTPSFMNRIKKPDGCTRMLYTAQDAISKTGKKEKNKKKWTERVMQHCRHLSSLRCNGTRILNVTFFRW